jgi:hypothetical protein
MALPTVKTVVNFSSGASFGQTLVLGTGILDQDVLGDAAALIVDVTAQVQNIQITRGRNLLTEQFQTGTATIVLADQLGYWNPQNTAGPYYGQLLPLRKIQISAIDPATSISYYLFSGYITSYNYRQSQDVGEVSTTTLTALDATQLLTLATVSTVTGAVAGETTGARFGRILDTIGWPSGQRDVDTGLTTVQADPGTARTASAALSTVALTEFGAFYIDAGGNVVFQDRNVTAGSIAGTPTAFVDTGAGIRYSNADFKLDDSQIFNQANVTAGAITATYKDQTSIDTYFLHSYDATNLLMQTTTAADNWARAMVASRKDTTIRCDSITLNLNTPSYTSGITAALSLDYFDPITVTQTQPGASSITKTLQIFGVAHSINYLNQSWFTRFTTAEPILDSFILDNALYGVLDQNVLSY